MLATLSYADLLCYLMVQCCDMDVDLHGVVRLGARCNNQSECSDCTFGAIRARFALLMRWQSRGGDGWEPGGY